MKLVCGCLPVVPIFDLMEVTILQVVAIVVAETTALLATVAAVVGLRLFPAALLVTLGKDLAETLGRLHPARHPDQPAKRRDKRQSICGRHGDLPQQRAPASHLNH